MSYKAKRQNVCSKFIHFQRKSTWNNVMISDKITGPNRRSNWSLGRTSSFDGSQWCRNRNLQSPNKTTVPLGLFSITGFLIPVGWKRADCLLRNRESYEEMRSSCQSWKEIDASPPESYGIHNHSKRTHQFSVSRTRRFATANTKLTTEQIHFKAILVF